MDGANLKFVDPSSYDWDDSELIRLYDEGMKEVKNKIRGGAKAAAATSFADNSKGDCLAVGGKSGSLKKTDIEWQVNDHCQAIFSEDEQWYEAIIKAANSDGTWRVEFIGYGNVEDVGVESLAPSKGASARHEQIEHSQKDWKVGDYCWALYYEDNQWYEGKIVQIIDEDTVTVKYLGYGNEEDIPICNLKPSQQSSPKSKHKCHRDSSIDNYSEENCSLSSHCSSMTGSYSSYMSSGDQKRFPRSRRMPTEDHEPHGSPHLHNRRHMHRHRAPSGPPNSIARRLPSLPPFPTDEDDDTLSALLLSWYMAGYHTGYHMGMRSRSRH